MKKKNEEKIAKFSRPSFPFSSLSVSLSLSLLFLFRAPRAHFSSLSRDLSSFLVEAPVQVSPRDPLQRDHEGGGAQRQPLLARDAPDVLEGGRHRLVEPLFLLFLF